MDTYQIFFWVLLGLSALSALIDSRRLAALRATNQQLAHDNLAMAVHAKGLEDALITASSTGICPICTSTGHRDELCGFAAQVAMMRETRNL